MMLALAFGDGIGVGGRLAVDFGDGIVKRLGSSSLTIDDLSLSSVDEEIEFSFFSLEDVERKLLLGELFLNMVGEGETGLFFSSGNGGRNGFVMMMVRRITLFRNPLTLSLLLISSSLSLLLSSPDFGSLFNEVFNELLS